MIIFGEQVPEQLLSSEHLAWLRRWNGFDCPAVGVIWQTMDDVWDSMGISNTLPLNQAALIAYYSHPIWTLNGLYTAADPVSRGHRKAISMDIRYRGLTRGADYAGGFGTLASEITLRSAQASVDIVEPCPTPLAKYRLEWATRVRFLAELEGHYDFLVAQDVLEHIEDPVGLTNDILCSLRMGGIIYFANSFVPVIKCHLPHTFHLRKTFSWVIAPLGVTEIGSLTSAPHVKVFEKVSGTSCLDCARKRERISRVIGPRINSAFSFTSDAYKSLGALASPPR